MGIPSAILTFTDTAPRLVVASILFRSASYRVIGRVRTPRLDVSRRMRRVASSSSVTGTRALSIAAGRFFFIWMGVNQTSSAPTANSCSWVYPSISGVESSMLVSSKMTRASGESSSSVPTQSASALG